MIVKPMREGKKMKTIYVSQFPIDICNQIYNDVRNALYELGYRGRMLDQLINDAMNSKLCDLENTIDITKYQN